EIQDNSMDMASLISTMMSIDEDDSSSGNKNKEKVKTRKIVADMLDSVSNTKKNNMKAFKEYIESKEGKEIRDVTKAIEYQYHISPIVYNEDTSNGLVKVSPNGLLERLGMSDFLGARSQFMSMGSSQDGSEVWSKLPDDKTLRNDNFTLVKGQWPTEENEVVRAVDQNNEISDYVLYALGLMDQNSLVNNYKKFVSGDTQTLESPEVKSYTMDELMDVKFKLIQNTSLYEEVNGVWIDRSEDEDFVKGLLDESMEVKVVGIIQPKENNSQSFYGKIYYTKEMQDYIVNGAENSEIVKAQKADKNVNIFTGKDFSDDASFDLSSLSPEQQMQMANMSEEELLSYMTSYNENATATYSSVLQRLGVIDEEKPNVISLYVSDFESKEKLSDAIEKYNEKVTDKGDKNDVISYTDFIGIMLRSVTQVIDLISYVLIGFVSVSLVVSSIMIGIITYISVLERTKEIGILRSIGASKRDISRVFNAETFIVGLISGVLGILVTLLLLVPVNLIVEHYSGVAHIAKLPWQGAIVLILLSLILTMIAGLIPARIASKKDPVEALRTE
ncbi:MAG: ABC transporter permease, partial [Erysipelotrichaceae bacterium]|nr:ABC transporter permease [Erysipelotrichaceae bacterium]